MTDHFLKSIIYVTFETSPINLISVNEVSYAEVVGGGDTSTDRGGGRKSEMLCPLYLVSGSCPQGDACNFIHGLLCEVCQLACLHPNDEEQRKKHTEVMNLISDIFNKVCATIM